MLSQAYADATQVTDELVDCILQPGLQVSLVQPQRLSQKCDHWNKACTVRIMQHMSKHECTAERLVCQDNQQSNFGCMLFVLQIRS